VLPMVRVDRLYLGPMFAPDQLGSDQMCLSLKLGRELLPAPASAPVYWAFRRPRPPCCSFVETVVNKCLWRRISSKNKTHLAIRTRYDEINRKTIEPKHFQIPKKEE
jgi:hypothetical protein